jgi:serine O-acetyltransferase
MPQPGNAATTDRTNQARHEHGNLPPTASWFRLRTKFLGERLGFTIPRNVFGPGLSIQHAGMIVVNNKARVGANCMLHHGVTIGEPNGKAPVIGDDV